MEKLIHYMLGNTTYVIAPADPLRYLMSKSYLFERAAKWIILLQEFNLLSINQNFIKG